MGIEETYIRKIEGMLRGIRLGTKEVSNTDFYTILDRFKKINSDLADDYQNQYIKLIQDNKKLVS